MDDEPNLARRRSKRTGVWLCAGSLAAAGIFLIGLFQGAYWALAIPVAIGVFAALNLVFWIGFTINTIEVTPKEAEHYGGEGPRRIALVICVGAVALGVLFLVGVFQGAYLALAIPVAAAVLSLLGMVYWIGWTIITQRTTLGHLEPAAPPVEQKPDSAVP